MIDFYPSNFKVDLNGKKFAWQVGLLNLNNFNKFWLARKRHYEQTCLMP